MRSPFQTVSTDKVRRSVFDLSYTKKLTADYSWLYPVMCDECVPGDIWTIGASSVVRFNPLVAPVMHEINIYTHYFFVPYRLLDPNWEAFITGGRTGDAVVPIPTWPKEAIEDSTWPGGYNPTALPYLWDYLGMPTDIEMSDYDADSIKPIDYPRLAYYFIYGHYYWDENLGYPFAWIDPDTLKVDPSAIPTGLGRLMQRSWTKDYFTSALPWQQRGTAPSLPISGTLPVSLTASLRVGNATGTGNVVSNLQSLTTGDVTTNLLSGGIMYTGALAAGQAGQVIGSASAASATTFNVSDLRLVFQVQKWLERNARSGVRYTEFLKSHFSVHPRDDRLQRPEYIGGTKSPIVVSEVLQTSASQSGSTPQANMAGHGISAGADYVGKYKVTEFGLIMGLMSIMPVPVYEDGINRQWIKQTRYDFYFPEFAHLSEQAIYNAELRYVAEQSNDAGIFGFQGRWDELRYKPSMVVGKMRQSYGSGSYAHWHCGRHFSPASVPPLNENFLNGGFNGSTEAKRILAVPSEDAFLVNFANHLKVVRPLPVRSEPGLIDHG